MNKWLHKLREQESPPGRTQGNHGSNPAPENSTASTNSTPRPRESEKSAATPAQRLAPLAKRYRVPLDDLLTWYADDLEDIATLPAEALEWLVSDYAKLRPWYRAGMPNTEKEETK